MKRPLTAPEVALLALTNRTHFEGLTHQQAARLLDHVATLEALLDEVEGCSCSPHFLIGWRSHHRLDESDTWTMSPSGSLVPITAEELLALTHIPDQGYVNEILREMEADRA